MLWQHIPAPALGRIRSSNPAGCDAATPAALPSQAVLNILWALRIQDQALHMHRSGATEPCMTRILHLDESERALYLAPASCGASLAAPPEGEAVRLFGELGSVSILLASRILGDARLGDIPCHRAEIPRDVLYLQARRAPRVQIDPALHARLELRLQDEDAVRAFRILDLSESGAGLEADEGQHPFPERGLRIAHAALCLPVGRLTLRDMEIVRVGAVAGRMRAGARFSPSGKRVAIKLRRWLAAQAAPPAGA